MNRTFTIPKMAWIAIISGVCYWLLESAIHTFILNDTGYILNIIPADLHEFWMRSLIAATVVLFGYYAQFIMKKCTAAERTAQLAHIELTQIFDTAADGMRVIDKNCNVLRINQAFFQLSGIHEEESLHKKCYELFYGPYCHTPNCPLIRIMNGDRRVVYDVVKERKDGVRVQCMLTATPFRASDGTLLGIVEHFKDVSERKQVEQALQVSKNEYKNLVENINVGIYRSTFGAKAKFIKANSAIMKMFGFENKKDFFAINIVDLFRNPEERKQFDRKMLKRGSVENEELHFMRKDGESFIASVSAVAVKDCRGNIQYYDGMVEDITERKRAEQQLHSSLAKLQRVMEGTIQAMARVVEMKDPFTAGHQRRVADLASMIASEMGCAKEQIEGVFTAAIIHDIGKINIPTKILNKPSELTDVEFGLVQTHPQVAYDILQAIDFPWPVAQIVFQHHERMDGSGYPRGIGGSDILLEARIIAVADVVEALVSHRPYRRGLSMKEVLEKIVANKGVLYDVKVVDACYELITKKGFSFEKIL